MSGARLERTDVVRTTWTDIGKGLRSLWQATLQNHEGGDVARALTANFIGVASADDAAALREATDRLQRRTPSRAFLLLLGGRAGEATAELAATTRCQGKLRDIVLEEITVHVDARDFASMPGLIRPLLVNDLPTHLYWAAPWPGREHDLDLVAGLADSTVVDSRRFGNPARELTVVADRRSEGQRLTDLNWLRLRPWRRALAEAFERFPWRPGASVRGEIQHGRDGGAAAILLADWLHERLDAAIAVRGDSDFDAAGPTRVQLRIDEVEIELHCGGTQLTAKVSTPEHCFLPFSMPASRGSDGDLLAAAIDVG